MSGEAPKEEVSTLYSPDFYSRCRVMDKICLVMIQNTMGFHVASTEMVDKLHLQTFDHPKPFKLPPTFLCRPTWVTKQVLVKFQIGTYVDTILCNVLPIENCQLLLGRPWKFDKQATFNKPLKRYSFMHQDRKIGLAAMSSQEVKEYQERRFQRKREEELARVKVEEEVHHEEEEAAMISPPSESTEHVHSSEKFEVPIAFVKESLYEIMIENEKRKCEVDSHSSYESLVPSDDLQIVNSTKPCNSVNDLASTLPSKDVFLSQVFDVDFLGVDKGIDLQVQFILREAVSCGSHDEINEEKAIKLPCKHQALMVIIFGFVIVVFDPGGWIVFVVAASPCFFL